MLVNICINLHILFGLLLDAQSKFSKHANSFVAHCRGGGIGGQHGGWHVQWEARTVGGRHVLGRHQVGEWRGQGHGQCVGDL